MALGVSNPEPTYDMRSEETQIYALELQDLKVGNSVT